ncbi:hypothetical protein CSW46_02115 [Thermus scotoductus]|nr:hypothetical protein CSW46_02115 [Thermus scotoductus]
MLVEDPRPPDRGAVQEVGQLLNGLDAAPTDQDVVILIWSPALEDQVLLPLAIRGHLGGGGPAPVVDELQGRAQGGAFLQHPRSGVLYPEEVVAVRMELPLGPEAVGVDPRVLGPGLEAQVPHVQGGGHRGVHPVKEDFPRPRHLPGGVQGQVHQGQAHPAPEDPGRLAPGGDAGEAPGHTPLGGGDHGEPFEERGPLNVEGLNLGGSVGPRQDDLPSLKVDPYHPPLHSRAVSAIMRV